MRLNEQKISPSSVFLTVLYLYFNGAAEVIAASLSSSVLRFWNSFDYFLPMENPFLHYPLYQASYINYPCHIDVMHDVFLNRIKEQVVLVGKNILCVY